MVGTVVLVELLFFLAVLASVVLAVRFLTASSPAWTRKLVFWLILAVIWSVPAATFHWFDWVTRPPAPAGHSAPETSVDTDPSALRSKNGKFEDPVKVFGPEAGQAQIRNAVPMFPVTFEQAEAAQLALFPSGGQAIVAACKDAKRAEFALSHYWGLYGLGNSHGDARSGWITQRDSGETVHTLVVGRYFFAWIGADEATVRRMRSQVPAIRSSSVASSLRTSGTPVDTAVLPLGTLGTAASLLLTVWWLVRGSHWRLELPPTHHMPAPANSLRAKLLEMNFHDLPFAAEQSAKDRIDVTWRAGDPRWTSGAPTRTYRLSLTPDIPNRRVRVRRFEAEFKGAGTALHWKPHVPLAAWLRPGDGEFSLDRLESAVSDVVRRSGWSWQPIVFDAPRWLRRWLE